MRTINPIGFFTIFMSLNNKDMTKIEEIWKPIPGFPHHQASSYGRVRRLDHTVKLFRKATPITRFYTGKMLCPYENGDGYLLIQLSINKKHTFFSLHRLIAQVFIDNPKNLPEINHKDLNPKNNHVSNLEWVTPRQNIHHSLRTRNSTRLIGAHKEKRTGKYYSSIYFNRKKIYLGVFATAELASKAYFNKLKEIENEN